jgi:hypothetical protein
VAARRGGCKILVRDAERYCTAMLRSSTFVLAAFAATALTACGDGKKPAATAAPTLTYFTMTN